MGGYLVLLRYSRHLERLHGAQHGSLGFAVAEGEHAKHEPVPKDEGSLWCHTEKEKGQERQHTVDRPIASWMESVDQSLPSKQGTVPRS